MFFEILLLSAVIQEPFKVSRGHSIKSTGQFSVLISFGLAAPGSSWLPALRKPSLTCGPGCPPHPPSSRLLLRLLPHVPTARHPTLQSRCSVPRGLIQHPGSQSQDLPTRPPETTRPLQLHSETRCSSPPPQNHPSLSRCHPDLNSGHRLCPPLQSVLNTVAQNVLIKPFLCSKLSHGSTSSSSEPTLAVATGSNKI